jgi:galacturan 1,4-alpha-galacturonidase
LFGTDGLKQGTISGLTFRNPPNWFNIIANSSELLISDLDLVVEVTNASYPAHVSLKSPVTMRFAKGDP